MPLDLDEEQRRRAYWSDLWFFVSVWLGIGAFTAIVLLMAIIAVQRGPSMRDSPPTASRWVPASMWAGRD